MSFYAVQFIVGKNCTHSRHVTQSPKIAEKSLHAGEARFVGRNLKHYNMQMSTSELVR